MVPLDDITWFDAEAWANSLECDDVTAGHCLTLMSQIMTGAVDKKMIPVNPLFGRKRQRSAEAKAEQEQKEQTELWVPPEAALQIARRLGRRNGMHILTTTFTGLRWGEGAGLHRDNALLERAEPHDGGTFRCPVLRVAQELAEYTVRRPDGTKDGMKIGIESVKTRAGRRDIDLPPFLAELLKEHLAAVRHDLVFSTPEGRPWRRSNFSRQILKPAAQGRTALPASKGHPPREEWAPIMPTATMRALRHTHDTLQAQIGVRPRLEYEQAGHEYPGIKGRYQHPTPDMRIARLEGLQEIYERALRSLGWKSVWGS
jgi:integrase